jgi:hypothetical protein
MNDWNASFDARTFEKLARDEREDAYTSSEVR